MALRLRRGTDAERQTITPQSGELLYVTDTGLVYVGDGTTQGGSLIGGGVELDPNPKLSANLDLNGNSIIGNGNINIDGNITATGNITIGDGVEDNVIVGGTISSSLIPTTDSAFDLGSTAFRWQNGHFTGLFVDGEISANTISLNNIIGPDSSIIYDSLTQSFDGNFRGSLIADDSTIIIDGDTGNANLNEVIAGDIVVDELVISDNLFSNGDAIFNTLTVNIVKDSFQIIPDTGDIEEKRINIKSNDNRSILTLTRSSPQSDISGDNLLYGSIFFEREDINGPLTTSLITARTDRLLFSVDTTGDFTDTNNYIIFRDPGLLGVGKIPDFKLDVEGEIVSSKYIQFGSFTTAERDELSVSNGAIIYNTTVNKFQGFADNSWVDLH